MRKNRQMPSLQNEEGSGLVLALMTLFVLSTLGAAVMAVAVGNARLTSVSGQGDAAFYVAEAGVNQAYDEIEFVVYSAYEETRSEDEFYSRIEHHLLSTAPSSLNEYTYRDFTRNFGDDPKAKITIEETGREGSLRTYRLISHGQINHSSRRLARDFEIHWTDPNPDNGGGEELPVPEPPTGGAGGYAAVVRSTISASSGEINGDLLYDSTRANGIDISWGTKLGQDPYYLYLPTGANSEQIITMPDWFDDVPRIRYSDTVVPWEYYESIVNKFPTIPDVPLAQDESVGGFDVIKDGVLYHTDEEIKQNDWELNLTSDIRFEKMKIGDNGVHRPLRINTNGRSINIVTDTIEISSGNAGIDIVGGGEVNLYVTEEIDFSGLGANPIGNPVNAISFNIYYSGGDFVLSGGMQIHGSLFIDEANITIRSGSHFTGFIVTGGDKVNIEHSEAITNTFLLAPFADVFISSPTRGLVIANSLNLQNTSLTYVNSNEAPPFAFAPHSDSQAPNLGEMIDLLRSSAIYEVE